LNTWNGRNRRHAFREFFAFQHIFYGIVLPSIGFPSAVAFYYLIGSLNGTKVHGASRPEGGQENLGAAAGPNSRLVKEIVEPPKEENLVQRMPVSLDKSRALRGKSNRR